MGRLISGSAAASEPTAAPTALGSGAGSDRWRSFDNSVSAVWFGFVATAILISMFLVMAIFERFLWRSSPDAGAGDVAKLDYAPSPKMTVYPKGVSVLMPGDTIPTFLAHPAPAVVAPPSTSEIAPRPIIHQSTILLGRDRANNT